MTKVILEESDVSVQERSPLWLSDFVSTLITFPLHWHLELSNLICHTAKTTRLSAVSFWELFVWTALSRQVTTPCLTVFRLFLCLSLFLVWACVFEGVNSGCGAAGWAGLVCDPVSTFTHLQLISVIISHVLLSSCSRVLRCWVFLLLHLFFSCAQEHFLHLLVTFQLLGCAVSWQKTSQSQQSGFWFLLGLTSHQTAGLFLGGFFVVLQIFLTLDKEFGNSHG